jgi:predicted RNase H-like HicB family nuclease
MRKVTYLAVFEPSKDGFGVYFPDLPGCISFGKTFEDAQVQAADALALHIYGMEKDGDILPKPSKNPAVEPETSDGYFVAPVTVFPDMVKNELDNKKVKTNVTLPTWLKDAAEQRGVNYSRLLESALIDYLDINPNHAVRK